tara:strand:- start:182 stop:490 length:309 start_codon:yes stop_codon:yes gene_type:complete
MQDEHKTKVIFRKWVNSGEIIALFPEEPADYDGYNCMSYMHIGQHGSASPLLIDTHTTLATPEEYADLRRELEVAIGYNLDIKKRIHQSYRVNRMNTAREEI